MTEKKMNKKILIVEDEPDAVKLTKFVLESEGFEVTAAYDGNDGLAKAREQKPDLIILDVKLPGMMGNEVAIKLMEDPGTANIPIVFLTHTPGIAWLSLGIKFKELTDESKNKTFLPKSCSNEELLSAIYKLLELEDT
jgi:CheY-like chemotaxis protein